MGYNFVRRNITKSIVAAGGGGGAALKMREAQKFMGVWA